VHFVQAWVRRHLDKTDKRSMLGFYHRRSQEFVLGPDNGGAQIETPKASKGDGYGEGVTQRNAGRM